MLHPSPTLSIPNMFSFRLASIVCIYVGHIHPLPSKSLFMRLLEGKCFFINYRYVPVFCFCFLLLLLFCMVWKCIWPNDERLCLHVMVSWIRYPLTVLATPLSFRCCQQWRRMSRFIWEYGQLLSVQIFNAAYPFTFQCCSLLVPFGRNISKANSQTALSLWLNKFLFPTVQYFPWNDEKKRQESCVAVRGWVLCESWRKNVM